MEKDFEIRIIDGREYRVKVEDSISGEERNELRDKAKAVGKVSVRASGSIWSQNSKRRS